MGVDDVLAAALESGRLVWGNDVSGETWPDAARSYLGNGIGVAWEVPQEVRQHARFVIDAEIVAPVRTALTRRYGVHDPLVFAASWTRAECLAKLDHTPIITWLHRHGLDLPDEHTTAAHAGRLAWRSEIRDIDGHDVMITFAAAHRLPETPDWAPQNLEIPGLSGANTRVKATREGEPSDHDERPGQRQRPE